MKHQRKKKEDGIKGMRECCRRIEGTGMIHDACKYVYGQCLCLCDNILFNLYHTFCVGTMEDFYEV